MILLIDNYDSFSYNLYQYLGTLNPDIKVIRNDELKIELYPDKKPRLSFKKEELRNSVVFSPIISSLSPFEKLAFITEYNPYYML